MIDFMYGRGYVMLYPNLREQVRGAQPLLHAAALRARYVGNSARRPGTPKSRPSGQRRAPRLPQMPRFSHLRRRNLRRTTVPRMTVLLCCRMLALLVLMVTMLV